MHISSPTRPKQTPSLGSTESRRKAARLIFCTAVLVILLDILPPTWPWLSRPKHWLSQVLNRVGLWQGQWTMFAPDPVLENALLSVEFKINDQKSEEWNSPDWKHVGILEKFYRFRHVNFFNRIHLDRNRAALNDFSDYLATHDRQASIRSLKIFRNSMTLLPSDNGTIPDRDDWIWVSRSDFLTERRYDP
jgi:hypothetical protein